MDHQIEKLKELHSLYANDEYVLQRLDTYIMRLLPSALSQAMETHTERTHRRERLLADEDAFSERFLSRNRYYFCQRPELFVHYDGVHFKGYSEDDITHQILTMITSEQSLVPWKHKVKNSIIKRIRDRSPIGETPESATIQSVLDKMWPECFATRNGAKHFLTAVGDCLRGARSLIYIIHPKLRELVAEIEQAHYAYFGSANALASFKLKYHDHDYNMCRFFQTSQNHQQYRVTLDLSRHIMDVLCVAVHYSQRYESADGFLTRVSDAGLRDLCFYVKDKTPEDVVDDFLRRTVSVCNGGSITSKSMFFIWKKFLDDVNVPNVMFHDKLSSLFKAKLTYDATTERYTDVTSTYLPEVSRFIEFWDKNMSEDPSAVELEIDEVLALFSRSPTSRTSDRLSHEVVSELIHHSYPDVVIEERKYICGVKCALWDKLADVEAFVEVCRAAGSGFASLYSGYAQYAAKESDLRMSKRCFEKILTDVLGDKVNDVGDIDPTTWSV